MTLLRKGACLSKIEERTESYWSQSFDRSNEGEFYSEEEWISVHKLSESMLHSLRVMTMSLAEFRVRWFLDSKAAVNCKVIRNDRIVNW